MTAARHTRCRSLATRSTATNRDRRAESLSPVIVFDPDRHPSPVLCRWAGNIWASTGCTSELSGDYDDTFPSTPKCVTNFCYADGTCSDYSGPSGVTTKAEFAMVESGLDFYDVSIIDGWVCLS